MASSFSQESLRLFHDACNRNILQNIEPFIQQGYPINSHAGSSFGGYFLGFTPLHFAVKNRNQDMVIYLLEQGADITEKNDGCWTPVHLAYYTSAKDLIPTIFEYSKVNTYINALDSTGLTHFHICCAMKVPVAENFLTSEFNINRSVSLLADENPGFTPLHFAIKSGYALIIRLLFEKYVNINITCGRGLTPLHLACEYSDLSTLELLLSFGAAVNIKDNEGRTALHCAVNQGTIELEIVKRLITSGASIHEPNLKNETPLELAVKIRQYEIVDTMLSANKFQNGEPLSFSDIFNLDDFHHACKQGNLNDIKLFVKNGFPVNSHASSNFEMKFRGYTPLHFAVNNADVDVMMYLLEQGVDITKKSDDGWTPSHLAYYTSREDLIPVIFEYSKINSYLNVADHKGLTHFHICCTLDIPDILEDFVMSGVELNELTSLSGLMPLHLAVKSQHISTVRLLLENGAKHNLKCETGSTPLHIACELGEEPIVKLLLDFGADLTAKDNNNRTPLHRAFYKFHDSQLVSTLLNKMPRDYHYPDSRRLSLLHIACMKGNKGIVQNFLDRGCSPNVAIAASPNNEAKKHYTSVWGNLIGKTPLHLAMYSYDIEIVQQLILAGADINAEDENYKSPLCYIYDSQNRSDGVMHELIAKHVTKLEMAGKYVKDKIKRMLALCRTRNYTPLRGRSINYIQYSYYCISELTKMQSVKINGCANENLRSVLRKNEAEMLRFVRKENVTKFLNPTYLNDLIKEFPLYGYMIKILVNKGLRRAVLIEDAKYSFKSLTGFRLPHRCYEIIFDHLTCDNLEDLIEAEVIR